LYPQKSNFGQAQCRLPDDDLHGPKRLGATVKKCFNVNLIFCMLNKSAFVGKRILTLYKKMHGTKIKNSLNNFDFISF